MIRRIFLPAVAFALFAAPAYAQDNCTAPAASPKIPDGKTAAAADIIAANKEVVAFMKSSDDYQTCLLTYINAQDAAAKAQKKTMDPKLKASVEAKGDANQKEKERVGVAYNTAATAYRQAHPR